MNNFYPNNFLNSMQNQYRQDSCPFIYVNNLDEAKSYPVVPNNTCIMFNNDFSAFYIKKVDSMGIPEISMFKAERVPIESSPIQADSKSVEIDELKREISELKSLFSQNLTNNGDKNEPKSNGTCTTVPTV